jgi:hypothetical protein
MLETQLDNKGQGQNAVGRRRAGQRRAGSSSNNNSIEKLWSAETAVRGQYACATLSVCNSSDEMPQIATTCGNGACDEGWFCWDRQVVCRVCDRGAWRIAGQAQAMGALTNVHNLVFHVLTRENHLDLLLRAQRGGGGGCQDERRELLRSSGLAVRGWGRCALH